MSDAPDRDDCDERAATLAEQLASAVDTAVRKRRDLDPIGLNWRIRPGVETGADRWDDALDERLTPKIRGRLARAGLRRGDPILLLPPGHELRRPWNEHPDVLVPCVGPRGFLPSAIDPGAIFHAVVLGEYDVPSTVIEALSPWQSALERRAGYADSSGMRWWEPMVAGDAERIDDSKILVARRSQRGRFALDDEGSVWCDSSAIAITPRDQRRSAAYLCSMLNSATMDLVIAVRSGSDPDARIRSYRPQVIAGLPSSAYLPGSTEIAEIGRRLGTNRRQLLALLGRGMNMFDVIVDPWRTNIATSDLDELERAERDGEAREDNFDSTARRARRTDEGLLQIVKGRVVFANIYADPRRLDGIEAALRREYPSPEEHERPQRVEERERMNHDRRERVASLLSEGRDLVIAIEQHIGEQFALPTRLTADVIALASERANEATSQRDAVEIAAAAA